MYYYLRLNLKAPLAPQFARVPETTTILDLSHNVFDDLDGHTLAEGFAATPANVSTLKLDNTELGSKNTGASLALALAAIPAGVTSLDLIESVSDAVGFRVRQARKAAQQTVSLEAMKIADKINPESGKSYINTLKNSGSPLF